MFDCKNCQDWMKCEFEYLKNADRWESLELVLHRLTIGWRDWWKNIQQWGRYVSKGELDEAREGACIGHAHWLASILNSFLLPRLFLFLLRCKSRRHAHLLLNHSFIQKCARFSFASFDPTNFIIIELITDAKLRNSFANRIFKSGYDSGLRI